jgi:delta 1-pyrroline-5-carboxylate dehydrogenase
MGFSGAESYSRAYRGVTDDSAKTLASELMKNPEVQERIASYESRQKAQIERAFALAVNKLPAWIAEQGRDRASLARLAGDWGGKSKKQIELSGPDGDPIALAQLSDADLARIQAEIDALKKKAE